MISLGGEGDGEKTLEKVEGESRKELRCVRVVRREGDG